MKFTPVWLARVAAVALALPLFAACGDDSTAPADEVNLAEAQLAVDETVRTFFTENPGIESLEIFGSFIGAAVPSIATYNLDFLSETRSMYGLPGRLYSMVSDARTRTSTDASLFAIPDTLVGTTFEWDSTTNGYQPGSRTGAPADGVRFILYDNLSDLNEIGYLDFSDRSDFAVTPATIDISLSIFVTDPSLGEVVSYGITGSAEQSGGTLVVDGFLSDGVEQLDFDFLVSGSESTGFEGNSRFTAGDFGLSLDFSEDSGGAESIGIEITSGDDTILFVLNADADGEIISGSGIFLNTKLVATFSGNVETGDVSVVNAEADPLTQKELLALTEIFVATEQAIVLTGELLGLGLTLIGIAVFF